MEDPVNNKFVSRCRICGNNLTGKPWHSEWELNQHYKTNTCNQCGKKTWVKVDFIGSGDDDWKPNVEEGKE